MIDTQKGNTLINVLIISVVFMALGLSIMAATINSSKRTILRETDVDITYDAVKAIDQMVADLSLELTSNHSLDINNLMPNTFTNQLSNIISDILEKHIGSASIQCIKVVDMTGSSFINLAQQIKPNSSCSMEKQESATTYHIDEDSTLTRAIEIIVVVHTPHNTQGYVTRTVRKRLILSPMPSFLKYVAGTRATLVLNGSPNFVGNIYANDLKIDQKAYYQVGQNTNRFNVETPYPAIHGNIYSNSVKFLPTLVEENFYNKQVPELKNDSQFVDINFQQAFDTETLKVLKRNGLDSSTSLKDQLIENYKLTNIIEVPSILQGMAERKTVTTSDVNDEISSYKLKLIDKNSNGPLRVPEKLVISNVSSNITVDDLFVNGDLYVLANRNINLKNIVANGDIYLISQAGDINVNGNIYATGDITLLNDHSLNVAGDIITDGKVSITGSKTTDFPGNFYSTNDLLVNPTNTAFSFKGEMITNGNYTIKGDSIDAGREDDEVIFDSVVYAKGSAYISNVNILGVDNNEKELVLLAGGKLTITRMNEFNHYQNQEEKNGIEGVPLIDSNIKPLHAFFYTEQNAELYGVGSLFYINGGLFARGNTADEADAQLEINAIRGNIDKIENVVFKNSANQQDLFSRFIVVYDKSVLLKRIDALPKVNNLTLYADDLTVD